MTRNPCVLYSTEFTLPIAAVACLGKDSLTDTNPGFEFQRFPSPRQVADQSALLFRLWLAKDGVIPRSLARSERNKIMPELNS